MKRSLLVVPCLLIPCFALSACTSANEKTYGPSITRVEAESHLDAIQSAVNASTFTLPAAYSATDANFIWVVIAVVPYNDKITYDATHQFYHDVYGGNEYWAFVKDGTVYEAKSETSTVSSKETTNQSYVAYSGSWEAAVSDMVSQNNKARSIFNSAPEPTALLNDAVRTKVGTIKAGLKAWDTTTSSSSNSSSAGTTVTIKDEEYRSKAEGQLYVHYTSVSKDSNGTTTTEHTYIFENYLLTKYYEKSGLFPVEIEMAYSDVKLDYPTFSPTTSSAA